MVFTSAEIIYYAAVLLSGALGGFCRLLREQVYPGFVRSFSSVLSSGIITLGAVGFWIGYVHDSVVGPVYYFFAAIFVGYFTLELINFLKMIIKSLLRGIFKRMGFPVEEESIN